MRHAMLAALMLGAAALPTTTQAQSITVNQAITGTKLDVSATGKVTRVPDIAIISAGVVTRATTAVAALQQNANRMERVRTALKRAGIEDRDIQTSNISLNPEYRYDRDQPPRLTGYTASNTVNVRFRDIRKSGEILDALVAEGSNQINGPTLTIDKPEAAMDEARMKAVAVGRQRADIYARALGMRVVRLLSVSETGGHAIPPPMPVMMRAEMAAGDASTKIDPGEQEVQVTIAMSFELQ